MASPSPARAWVALGSNLGPSRDLMCAAAERLSGLPGTRLDAISSLYRTPPWGDRDQADFLNAVARIRTGVPPLSLLQALQEIETALGRVRDVRRPWGPRLMDLDLLLHEAGSVETPELQLPHPRLHERAFVLVPLGELDPFLELPGRGTVTDCLEGVSTVDIVKIEGAAWVDG